MHAPVFIPPNFITLMPPARRGGFHEIAGAFARHQPHRRQALRAPVPLNRFFVFSPFNPLSLFLNNLIDTNVCNSFFRPHSHADSLNRSTRHWRDTVCVASE